MAALRDGVYDTFDVGAPRPHRCRRCGRMECAHLTDPYWDRRPTGDDVSEANMMKDPIILCPKCLKRAYRVRHKNGIRCVTVGCVCFEMLAAHDREITKLRAYLADEQNRLLFEWARSCQRTTTPCVRPQHHVTEPPIL